MKKLLVIFLFIAAFLGAKEARFLNFPDINGDLIAFSYAGDIWTVSAQGGEARRLTAHPGLELFPKISPDGRWIAFSAEYSGNRQIHIMPANGGASRQLTFYNDVGEMPPRGGFDYVVLGWTADSKKVFFRANRTPFGEREGKYFLVSIDGGMEEALPLPEGGAYASFSEDGSKIAYTPISREFRNWKRYKGGRAQDVWIYDLKKNKSERVTDFRGTDMHPIWYKDRIYFVSDRDLVLNIYCYDLSNREIVQVTRHKDFDVLWPSGKNGRIVYQCGAQIYVLNLENHSIQQIKVEINYDNPYLLPVYKNVSNYINSYTLAPDGKNAYFEARGDLFVVPEKNRGEIENVSRSSGIREIYPVISPDGRMLAFYSDQSGEYEVYVRYLNEKRIEKLTEGSKYWKFPPCWSPDSKKLLFGDKEQRLQLLDLQTKKLETVVRSSLNDIMEYSWSPDGRWILYLKDVSNGHSTIWLYSLEQKREFQLTSGFYNDYEPVFSPDGKYIFFLSERDFNLQFSSFEFDYLYNKATRIYVLPLLKNLPSLIPDYPEEGFGENVAKKKEIRVEIDFSDLENRVFALPLEAGGYSNLNALENGVIYLKESALMQFIFKEKKEQKIAEGIQAYILSSNKKKLLARKKQNYAILDVSGGQDFEKNQLNLERMVLRIEPQKEWRQIFNDGYIIFRDWFYVKNMHGVDWEKIRNKYLELVQSISCSTDLYLLFHEMLGEVNVGHAYVNWGEREEIKRIENGLLGCEFIADQASGLYRVGKIYPGENWSDDFRSPLTEQGIDIKSGDYILELNNYRLTTADNPYLPLENCAGRRIPIVVNNQPNWQGARTYWVKPVKSELKLLYLDWVRSRRDLVDKLSGGRIGYLHLPDTAVEGNRELFKGLYAFHDKEALIIDDRYNGGGFIPVKMIEMIARRPINYWARRGLELIKEPFVAHSGPKVMLINHYSSSGGDAIAYYFKQKKLGLLIGTRTWGGLVGISGNPRFVDGGFFNVPTFGFVNKDGEWDVEGMGVAPDIEVYDLPEAIIAGGDPSIEKAVEVLLKELQKNPPEKVKKPADPDRSGWIEKEIN